MMMAPRFFRDNRVMVLSVGALLVLVLAGVVIYWLVTYAQSRLCIASVLNSTKDKLAFEKYQPEADNAIYIMTTDGGWGCRVSGDSYSDYAPAWSPDGKHIAFNSYYYPSASHSSLFGVFLMNNDGTERRMIVGGDPRLYYGSPTWSPDSKSIAFTKIADDRSSRLYVVSTQGTDLPRLVIAEGFEDNSPAWSPDGKRLAFVVRESSSSLGNVYVADIDGSNEHRLTENGGWYPTWSPDGQQIVFIAPHANQWDMFIMDADGTNVHRLAVDGGVRGHPAWSPDGRQFAFTGGGSIYVVNIDGSGLRRLTTPDDYHIDSSPSWNGNNYSAR